MHAFGKSRRRSRLICLGLYLLAPLLVGCQGCRDETLPDEAAEQRPAAEISHQPIRTSPEDPAAVGVPVKPGHWMSVGQSWKANTQDYRGALWTAPAWLGEPSGQQSNRWPMHSVRPAVLPKGQTKRLESRILIPPSFSSSGQRMAVRGRFEAPRQGIVTDSGADPAMVMAPDEYFFVVLTQRPEQFSILQVQDWVRPPLDPQFSGRQTLDYRVVIPVGEGMLPIPDTFFEWTSTAYVLWDDVEPGTLTEDQRRAVRDWLHWGGQIILNGPAAARALAGSEFADLVPIEPSGSERLEAERLISLLQQWSVPSDRSVARLVGRLDDNASRAGVAGETRAGVAELPKTAGLVVEQRVGRGRVAMTRFDLGAGWLPEWGSLQSFYNGALLRRPPRAYQTVGEVLRLGFIGAEGERTDDPRLATQLRIFARDAALPVVDDASATSQPPVRTTPATPPATTAIPATSQTTALPGTSTPGTAGDAERLSPWLDTNVSFAPGTGMGSWTDRSDTGLLATDLLREEAGITIPKSSFVAKSLAIYLLVLVPLNCLIFGLLGRLEWAWLTVPLIGLVGAAVIARSAQLDIGFARSRTEIDLLEIQAGYSRGHLSRYLAIYNSLSTSYAFRFENRDAVAAPVGMVHASAAGDDFGFRQAYEQGVTLTGLSIASNQTKAIHAEQMLELGGSIHFDPASGRLENASELSLWDAAVIARDDDGELRSVSIGTLSAGTIETVRLRSGTPAVPDELPMGVQRMLRRLTAGDDLARGEYRLVARCETAQPGLVVVPAVSQTRQQTVVLVHLVRPPLPPPETDRNLRSDFPVAAQEHD